MMRKAMRNKILRQGIAAGLVLVAIWCIGITLDTRAVIKKIFPCAEESALWLPGSFHRLPGQKQALNGWGRLMLLQSPELAHGAERILKNRSKPQAELPSKVEDGPMDHDDQTKPQLNPEGQSDIIEMTAEGKQGSSYLWGNGVCLYNRTKLTLDESVLSQGMVDVNMNGDSPQILIVHTHGTEAYAQTDGNTYEESDPYRTTDCTRNVVRVGEEIATVFRAHGFRVLHDTNLYDYPAYNGSYGRSQAAVRQWLKDYPSIQMVLDVHRDALVGVDGSVYKLVTEEAGEKVAQTMLVVGSCDAGAPHPRWQDNLAFAVKLQQGVTRGYNHLARPIVLRSKRYNQELLPGSLLLEVGGHGNSLTEAISGARLWADNVARTLKDMMETK